MKNDNCYISLPYIYPVCPLNIDHARMFVLADIAARQARLGGKKVYFPVASHYSGNTAQKIAAVFKTINSSNGERDAEQKKIINLYENIYGTPDYIYKNFTNPLNILDFYSQEILWEIKSLGVSCDYDYYYTTNSLDFSVFVETMISLYKKNGLIIANKDGKLALDYDNVNWKNKAMSLLEEVKFVQSFHKKNIIAAMKDVRSDWGFTRNAGYGATYGKWIVDPMFDSELFTIFNLYVKVKKENPRQITNVSEFITNLFDALGGKEGITNKGIGHIASWLPCDIFICEEHLKNWIVKRLYAESLLLDKKYRTKQYFITGMGLLDGKRMSASQGHAILAKDLINMYGSTRARLIILLTGGHPSRIYRYDKDLPNQADRLIRKLNSYLTLLIFIKNQYKSFDNSDLGSITSIDRAVESLMDGGYYRQAVLELFTTVPKKYRLPSYKLANLLLKMYKKYLSILLPGLIDNFDLHE